MTEKFTICNMGLNGSFIKENGKIIEIERVVDLLNELHDENQELKKKNKQLSIDFIDFKMKLIEQLQIHYDYSSEQRQKNLDDPFVAQAYDIIRCDVRNLAEEMGVDLE